MDNDAQFILQYSKVSLLNVEERCLQITVLFVFNHSLFNAYNLNLQHVT